MEKNTGRSVLRPSGARAGVLRGSRQHPTLIGTLMLAGRIREAIGVGEGALTHGNATREECEALARAYWSLGMGRSAERLSKGLAQQRPMSLEALVLLGEIYAERMWAAQLQSVVRRLAQDAAWHPRLPELTTSLETLGVEDSPPEGDDLAALVGRAEWCLKRGWIGEAEGILRQVLNAEPRHARAQELLWGCRRERRLEARFGPLAPGIGGEERREIAEADADESRELVAAEQASGEDVEDFHIDPTRLSDMLQPLQVVETLAGDGAEADDEDDEDDEEWEDDDDDEDEDDDDLETFSSFRGGAQLALGAGDGAGPSPLRERLRDRVIVIERGDRPRMIDGNGEENPKGIWFRGARDLHGEGNDISGLLESSPGVVASKSQREPVPSLGAAAVAERWDSSIGPRPESYMPVGQYGFDDEEESATEVVTPPVEADPGAGHRHRRVVSLLKGDHGQNAVRLTPDMEEWEEAPTRAVVDEVLKRAFIEEEEDTGTRILEDGAQAESWEREVATRVAGLDELDRAKHAGPHEPTKALPGRGLAGAQEPTVALPSAVALANSDETLPLPAGQGETTAPASVELHASRTIKVAAAADRTATVPRPRQIRHHAILPVPEEPSLLTSPALFLAVVVCFGLIWGGFSFQQSRAKARIEAVAAVVESMLLKGDAASIHQAQQTVMAAIDPSEPNPVFDAMAARVGWARWVEIGAGSVVPPDAQALKALSYSLGSNRDVMLATAYHDLFTEDNTRGVLRLEEALQAFPEDALLGTMLARMHLAGGTEHLPQARQALAQASGWVDSATLPAGPSGEALRPLLESQLAFVGVAIEYADGKAEAARKRLEEVAFLNPSHPWIDAYRAVLAAPPDAKPEEILEMYSKAQEGLGSTAAARPRAWLMAAQMDLAISVGKLDMALGLADRAMTADPTWPEALYRSAKAQVWRGDLQLALQRIQQAGELAPFNPDILEARVVLLLDAQEFGAAEQLLSQLPPGMDNSAQAWRAKTEIALARRDPAAAELHLNKAVERDPNSSRTLLLQARVGAIMEGRRRGRPPLDTLLARPEQLDLGTSHAQVQAWAVSMASSSEARKLDRAATKAAPRDPRVREILSEGYEARGDSSEAIDALMAAVKIAPNRVRTQVMLARLLALTGDRDAARPYWEASMTRCAEGPLCSEVAQLMQTKGPGR